MVARVTPHPPPLHIIDVEASGFGRGSYPIEVGFVLDDGRAHCTLIQPAAHWTHWDTSASALHGISRETLQRHGRPAAVVAALLNEQLAGQTIYSDAWAHDYAWLAILFEEAEMTPTFKLESVRVLLDEERLARLRETQRGALAAMGLDRHRASSDARALQLALRQLQNAAVPGA
jgi:hypothetical protein